MTQQALFYLDELAPTAGQESSEAFGTTAGFAIDTPELVQPEPEHGPWDASEELGPSDDGAPAPVELMDRPGLTVEVVRSARRRKTVGARLVGNLVRVTIPLRMSKSEEAYWAQEMLKRFERRTTSAGIDLAARAAKLAQRLGLKGPACIRWVDNQHHRWGSCTPADRSVRISRQLAQEPKWVLDYVIVHELAHLDVAGHNAAFWRLVDRYPLAERARGFLIARGLSEPGPDSTDGNEE